MVNVSLGGEAADSYRDSAVDEAAELLVQAGVVVVAAAGNDPLRPSLPPANARPSSPWAGSSTRTCLTR